MRDATCGSGGDTGNYYEFMMRYRSFPRALADMISARKVISRYQVPADIADN